MIKLKNKLFYSILVSFFFINSASAQTYFKDFDKDGLSDNISLMKDSLIINVDFGNKTFQNFEIPEILSLTNVELKYKNSYETSIFYYGDRGVYSSINIYYNGEWIIKDVNYYIPCQECKSQKIEFKTKTINKAIKDINSELIEINSTGYRTLEFYDYNNLIYSYNNIKNLSSNLSLYYLFSRNFSENDMVFIEKKFNLSKNLSEYNKIAHILSYNGNQSTAIYILKKILKNFPKRTIAYLNLADAYWDLGNKENAKENYKKYLSLMKSQKKDLKKIPKRVYERIK